MVASFVGFYVSMSMSHDKIMVRTRVLGYVHTIPDNLASEQAVRGALAAGRENEGELATTSLKFDFHLQFPCGSPSTELSDFRQSARSRNERECKQTLKNTCQG